VSIAAFKNNENVTIYEVLSRFIGKLFSLGYRLNSRSLLNKTLFVSEYFAFGLVVMIKFYRKAVKLTVS